MNISLAPNFEEVNRGYIFLLTLLGYKFGWPDLRIYIGYLHSCDPGNKYCKCTMVEEKYSIYSEYILQESARN